MGGYGAARIGMKHPDVFGSLYIMSPCCLSARGAGLREPGSRAGVCEAVRTPADEATLSFFLRAQLATAAAWSPDPKNPPLYLDLPTKDGVAQPDVLAKWAANAPLAFVDQYVDNLRSTTGSPWTSATRTACGSTPAEAARRSRPTTASRTAFEVYHGTHTSAVADRFQNHVLPFFSRNLCATGNCK